MLFRRGIGALRARISAGPSCRRVSVERGKSNGMYVNNQVEQFLDSITTTPWRNTKEPGLSHKSPFSSSRPISRACVITRHQSRPKNLYSKVLLTEKYGFPKGVKSLEFDPDFVIRGLFYDPKRCVMMKLDSYSVIDDKAVYRGLERVSESELENIYDTRRMGVHRTDKNFSRTGHYFYQVRENPKNR